MAEDFSVIVNPYLWKRQKNLFIYLVIWYVNISYIHSLVLQLPNIVHSVEVDSPPRGVPWKRLKTAKKSTKAARVLNISLKMKRQKKEKNKIREGKMKTLVFLLRFSLKHVDMTQ